MWGIQRIREWLHVCVKRGWRFPAVMAAVYFVSLAVLTQSAAAAVGDLTPAGCIGNSNPGPPSCIGADGLDGPESVAVSPDGRSVYVASIAIRRLRCFAGLPTGI